MIKFIRHTILGGLLVVLPVIVILILLKQAFTTIRAFFAPFAAMLPFETLFPGLWAGLALILLSFLAGLLLQIRPLRRLMSADYDWLSEHFPMFRLLRGFDESLLENRGDQPIKAALAEIEDALVPAFVMEELADGRLVVFVPAVPRPIEGALYILTRERVHLLDIGVGQVARCVSHWGVGSEELVKAMRKSV